MKNKNRLRALFHFSLLAAVLLAKAWAIEINGTVSAVSGDMVTIEHSSDVTPRIGDPVKISFGTPDGDSIEVGTWRVVSVVGPTVKAEVVESYGAANVDMRAVIHTEAQSADIERTPTREVESTTKASSALGVVVMTPTPRERKAYKIPSHTDGLLVESVTSGSAAEQAGIRAGDMIVSLNGNMVRSVSNFPELVARLPQGTRAQVEVLRQGRSKTFPVVIGELPEYEQFYKKASDLAKQKKYKEALRWLNKSADLGYAGAKNYLGLFYLNGWGTRKNYEKAAEFFRAAAEGGYLYGYFNLARLYETGRGLRKDDVLAMEYYRKYGDYIGEYQRGARMGMKEAQSWLDARGIEWERPQKQNVGQQESKTQGQPQKAGYDKQMKQQKDQQKREAAGKLLKDLLEMRDKMIENQNR